MMKQQSKKTKFLRVFMTALLISAFAGAAVAQVRWDFQNPAGKTFGWFSMHGLSSPKVIPGQGLKVTKTSNDPHLARRKIKLKAEEFDRLAIKMTISPNGEDFAIQGEPNAQFFWDVNNEGFSEERSIHFPVHLDGESHTYNVDLWSDFDWEGTVTAVRIDPIDNNTTGTLDFTIASVELRPLKEEELPEIKEPAVIDKRSLWPLAARLACATTYTVHLDGKILTSGTGREVRIDPEVTSDNPFTEGPHEYILRTGEPFNYSYTHRWIWKDER